MTTKKPGARKASVAPFSVPADAYTRRDNIFGRPLAMSGISIRNTMLTLAETEPDPARAELMRRVAAQGEDIAAFSLSVDGMVRETKKRLDAETTAAQQDGMTGLVNKKTFNEKLADHVILASTQGKPLSVIAFDADHFKAVNDTDGHAGGDIVIKKLADILRETLRKDDVPSRWGGDEFYAVLPDTDEKTAEKIAERIRKQVEAWVDADVSMSGKVTISVGVAQLRENEEGHALADRADKALYAAKCKRNCVELASALPVPKPAAPTAPVL